MAASPHWKVYSADGEYVASFKYPDDAASLLGARGDGTELRAGHAKRSMVFTEGQESFSASQSYDGVASVAYGRLSQRQIGPYNERALRAVTGSVAYALEMKWVRFHRSRIATMDAALLALTED